MYNMKFYFFNYFETENSLSKLMSQTSCLLSLYIRENEMISYVKFI